MRWWFSTDHVTGAADGTLTPFRYYYAQREAVETVCWLHDVRKIRDKFDLMRYDSSRALSAGMLDDAWPRYVLKLATVRSRRDFKGRLLPFTPFILVE